MNSKLRKLAEKDEEMVIASGIPYTIIRAGLLQNLLYKDFVAQEHLLIVVACSIRVEISVMPENGHQG